MVTRKLVGTAIAAFGSPIFITTKLIPLKSTLIYLFISAGLMFLLSWWWATKAKTTYYGEPVVKSVKRHDFRGYHFKVSIGNGSGEDTDFWTNKEYAVNDTMSNNQFVDLPEEWRQITSNPHEPDTLTGYLSGDTLYLQFGNQVRASGKNLAINQSP